MGTQCMLGTWVGEWESLLRAVGASVHAGDTLVADGDRGRLHGEGTGGD